jgi:hypothetical protein
MNAPKLSLLPVTVCVGFFSVASGFGAVSVAHVENSSIGEFISSSGQLLTTGGVTVGFFSGTAPTTSNWATLSSEPISLAYAALINPAGPFKFIDVNNIAGISNTGEDWTYPLPVGGTVTQIPLATLPTGTQLYVMAFDAGNLSNGFSGADQWAVADAADWVGPSDGALETTLLQTVDTPAELPIGSDAGDNSGKDIRLVSTPEPSVAILAGLGAGALCFRRRRIARPVS